MIKYYKMVLLWVIAATTSVCQTHAAKHVFLTRDIFKKKGNNRLIPRPTQGGFNATSRDSGDIFVLNIRAIDRAGNNACNYAAVLYVNPSIL